MDIGQSVTAFCSPSKRFTQIEMAEQYFWPKDHRSTDWCCEDACYHACILSELAEFSPRPAPANETSGGEFAQEPYP